MIEIPFIKMHSLGNDFIILKRENISKNIDFQKFIIKISDRRIGLGCDQLIVVDFLDHCYMNIYNQDGSQAEICGNAAMCIAWMNYENTKNSLLTIKTNNKLVKTSIIFDKLVNVDMGPALFDVNWMPKIDQIYSKVGHYKLSARNLICVDIGNPHLVIFHQNLTHADQELLGKKLACSDIFLNGVNVNFAKIDNEVINLNVWERGVGFTLACGTGACATFAAAYKLGLLPNQGVVKFKLGDLKMKILENYHINMSGQVEKIAKGIYIYEE